MTLQTKILAASFGALTLMAAAIPASAAVLSCNTDITTIGGFETAGSCQIGDKLFTFIDSDLDNTFEIEFLGAGVNVTFGGDTNITGPDTAFIEFGVLVLDPNFTIASVSVDSDVAPLGPIAGDTTVIKEIFDTLTSAVPFATIVSVDGGIETVVGLDNTFLRVRDTISVGEDDVLRSFNNTFFQAPEPASLGLLGLGLLGLGAVARRRRQVA